jgi:hypothetical protein
MSKSTPKTEFSQQFLDGMVARMGVSFHKYGPVAKAYPHKVSALKSLQERLAMYQETGNTEWLMDVANFAMIEFMLPAHDKAHFRPTDSDESPGRRWFDNKNRQRANQ